MLADSGKINSQSPEPGSVSVDELFTSGGILQCVVHRWSERQVSKEKQAGTEFPLNLPTDCGHSYRKPCRA
jgi:hypothetical protein